MARARREGKAGGNPQKSVVGSAPRVIDPAHRTRGRAALAGGIALLVGGVALAITSDGEALPVWRLFVVQLLGIAGAVVIALGGHDLDPRPATPATPDTRRWIYGGLAVAFTIFYGLLMWFVIPNRLPSGMLHLATVPVFTLVMAVGTLRGGRFGWWLAMIGGSLILLSTIVLIARILASAAFLAGVYGAFGKAASTFALVSVALIVEAVGLLPICQVKFLMSRPGRRTYGV